ncbi:MAG: hypothetical protein KC897_04150 [Candidatus Omnitrophica bacterium]|nr:hypothetical protein [Candidatus Omnitrophota bacterium]MCB9721878.1 hypothetical protein [Candidatus Omnitrophota bacterium]
MKILFKILFYIVVLPPIYLLAVTLIIARLPAAQDFGKVDVVTEIPDLFPVAVTRNAAMPDVIEGIDIIYYRDREAYFTDFPAATFRVQTNDLKQLNDNLFVRCRRYEVYAKETARGCDIQRINAIEDNESDQTLEVKYDMGPDWVNVGRYETDGRLIYPLWHQFYFGAGAGFELGIRSLVIAAILYFLTLAVVFIRWYRRTAPGYREGRSVGQ